MIGACIGDIIGSKYEFDNIKTKNFPLFSRGCDYTDDTIMTVAVADALLRCRKDQYENGGKATARPLRQFLVERMQYWGRKYPYPTGAYGGKFAQWLRQKDPRPYGSFGNGSAMRASPCGIAAVSLEEAQKLAWISACVSHDHPEGIKGAQAVASAVFLAKAHASKEEIRDYICENFYDLNFTLDEIRPTYRFDGSCQGSVPQALVAFLESDSFEDAMRNVISIGGDCDTTGAVTGAVAWMYYSVNARDYATWVYDKQDENMQQIRQQAEKYLPEEFLEIMREFHEVSWRRAGTYNRMGGCTGMMTHQEWEQTPACGPFVRKEQPVVRQPQPAPREKTVLPEEAAAITAICRKYQVLLRLLLEDQELNQWCRDYSAYKPVTTHKKLHDLIYNEMMHAFYKLDFFPKYAAPSAAAKNFQRLLGGDRTDLLRGMCIEIRSDYNSNGSLIYHSIAQGRLLQLMENWLKLEDSPKAT